ncbi:MAG: hypothetical protein KC422_19965 [Trueperaceae bacterium]|nr:hypothetical protein [Trueperaceae bacterium]
MINHQPYGIDDPYKPLLTERYPRDPAEGDEIQLCFTAVAEKAWVNLKSNDINKRFEALKGYGETFTAFLGNLAPGSYTYVIHTETAGKEASSEPFKLEVAHWVKAVSVKDVQLGNDRVKLELALSSGSNSAFLSLSFPQADICRFFFSNEAFEETKGVALQTRREGDTLTLSTTELELELNLQTLAMAARRPGEAPAFQGSASLQWLETSQGDIIRFESEFQTDENERLYGLGERFTGPNLKGKTWDTRVYEEYKEQGQRTYLPMPFVLSSKSYGLWLDIFEPAQFDLQGETHLISVDRFPSSSLALPLFLIMAKTPYEVTSLFTGLTGKIEVPPKWSFGPWMSANTWNNQAITEAAVARTLKEDIPATVLVLEAWSDESTFYIFNDASYEAKPGEDALRLRDFTFGGRWPDPKAMIDACHEQGIRVLLWQIPVLKQLEDTHAQHEADRAYAVKQGYLIQNEDGSPYQNKGWWFTGALIPDFTNPAARDWWFSKRQYLFEDLGIDGMKTDGGEHIWGRDLKAFDGSRGTELVNSFVHHYVSSYYRFVQENTKGDGLTFSRAGYTGAQQFPCHWAGDENSTWAAFKASILAGLSAGLCGVSMWAWDIAGFSGEIPTVELYARSVAMAAFCPIMQYHSELHQATENRERSPWNIAERHHDPRALDIYRRYAKLRMRLLDYLYAEAKALSEQGLPLMRLAELEFPEAYNHLAKDPYSYLFGRDLLVCPIFEKGASTRLVRLPPGTWVNLWTGTPFKGNQTLLVPAPLELIPVFIKADSPRLTPLLELAAQS